MRISSDAPTMSAARITPEVMRLAIFCRPSSTMFASTAFTFTSISRLAIASRSLLRRTGSPARKSFASRDVPKKLPCVVCLMRRAMNSATLQRTEQLGSERDSPLGRDEDVGRMRIGVEDAVDEHLLEIGLEELARQRLAVHVEPRIGAEIGDLGPRHVVHREHALAAVVEHRLRHDEEVELR